MKIKWHTSARIDMGERHDLVLLRLQSPRLVIRSEP